MADPQIAARGLRIAEQQDLAVLEFAAGGGVGDGGEQVHSLRDDGVAEVGFLDFAEPERDAERGRAASEGLRAVGIARDEFGAASVRVGNRSGREQRAFDLHVVDVLAISDPRFRLRALHCRGDFPDLRHRADFLRREIACHAPRRRPAAFHCAFSEAPRVNSVACGLSTPSVPPDQTKATRFSDLLGRDAEALGEGQRIRERREAAREIVGAAIALRLADQCDNLGRIDLTVVHKTLQSGNVVGAVHWQLVYADPQGILQVTRTIMIRLQSRGNGIINTAPTSVP